MEDRRLLAVDFVQVADTLDAELVSLQGRIVSSLNLLKTGATSIVPVLGDQLGDAARFVNDFGDDLSRLLESLGQVATPNASSIQAALNSGLSSFLVGSGATVTEQTGTFSGADETPRGHRYGEHLL